MKEQLMRAMQRNQLVDIIYVAKDRSITKRRIKIIAIAGNTLQAYCFVRHAKREFKIDNILAITPVIHRERVVI
ncbi:transcriptional regulator [Solibacillus sp. FSL R7-0682]|uniref:transcriptional regulator n=1 Tax=Solibacillus sp. FSL R7-0682 TaxID=2921690 RepID=UPI0030FAE481